MPTMDEKKAIAETIISQLTHGGGAARLSLMLGTTTVRTSKNDTTGENGVAFDFKMSRRANFCMIMLNASDLYTMTFAKESASGFKTVEAVPGLFAEDLSRVFYDFTKLATCL